MNNLVDIAPKPQEQQEQQRPARATLPVRWWVYQRERFPLVTHVPLIAAFSFCTLSYSSLARGQAQMPSAKAICVAFVTALLFFLQLRISDEFKDAKDDAMYRPYRPVPRGLIALRELGIVAVAGALIQLALALWLSPALLPLLLLVWGYLTLMSREFFVSRWLKAHPVVYMWSHMLILPLIDLYGTACDWRVAGVDAPPALAFLLLVSFCNGFVVEIGRKIRAPQDEEYGVETYSALWGRRNATIVWLGMLGVTAIAALLAAAQIAFALPVGIPLALLLVAAGLVAARFLRTFGSHAAKGIETVSGLWTLLMYLGLGAAPLIWRLI